MATTIAPTGTLSIIAGCSSGIEPLYAISTRRIAAGGIELTEIDPVFRQAARHLSLPEGELKIERCAGGIGGIQSPIPRELNELFVTALTIEPAKHVEMQAAFQRHTDNAVSKTINFPSQISAVEMGETLKLAYELGCKGITIYRDKSRAGQVIRCSTDRIC